MSKYSSVEYMIFMLMQSIIFDYNMKLLLT